VVKNNAKKSDAKKKRLEDLRISFIGHKAKISERSVFAVYAYD